MKSTGIISFLTSLDIFGHPIGVHFKNESSYKTKLGAFFSLAVSILILITFLSLLKVFNNGER